MRGKNYQFIYNFVIDLKETRWGDNRQRENMFHNFHKFQIISMTKELARLSGEKAREQENAAEVLAFKTKI